MHQDHVRSRGRDTKRLSSTSAVTGHERKTLFSVAAFLSAPVHGLVISLCGGETASMLANCLITL